MPRKVLIAAGVALIALVAVGAFVVFPSGSGSANEAMLSRVNEQADGGTAKVLASRDWGSGSLVAAGFDRRGEHRIAVAYVADELRGWRVRSYTESVVEITDVVVGSLLTASSDGGAGAPAWSAAVGELADPRIEQIRVSWASGEPTVAPRTGQGYIVVREGRAQAREVRYGAENGEEIATVPVAS